MSIEGVHSEGLRVAAVVVYQDYGRFHQAPPGQRVARPARDPSQAGYTGEILVSTHQRMVPSGYRHHD